MKAFLAAVQFLTVIPVGPAAGTDPARSAVFFPLVGALLGGVAVAVWALLRPALPQSLIALLVLALWAVLTGGLHEDGLADTCDAFGPGRSREQILRILKDSRVGAFGALALIFSVLLRWQALALLPAGRWKQALLLSQVLPRAGMVLLGWLAGGATPGLGDAFAAGLKRRHALGAAAVAMAIAAPVARWDALPPALACLLLILLLGWCFRRRIGGVTGDCLGAANQLQEIGVLVVFHCL